MNSLGAYFKMDTDRSANRLKYDCLFFDMDDTLYPMSSGLNLACRKNIQDFMLHHLNIEETEVPRMCLDLYREHGTTMAGLKVLGYEFDDDEFHAIAHGRLPYDKLKPDPVLRNLLLTMPQRKIIFTNADKVHAAEVLKRLGMEDCFEGIICFETLNPPVNDKSCCSKTGILCKPALNAFEAAIRIANVDPRRTIFFDDSTRNIATGKAAGLHTVIVGSSSLVAGADHALSSIHNIKEAIPEIWEGEGEQQEQVIQSAQVETPVLA
ncbi:Haloacid dehalogenase-like hydrolase (HAD) superfamily protein [Euphorbia peplus]|nr:Haloacid dehalogenase-like hydrolase (HAD) superfamily protein [Euphorbia peplus]